MNTRRLASVALAAAVVLGTTGCSMISPQVMNFGPVVSWPRMGLKCSITVLLLLFSGI